MKNNTINKKIEKFSKIAEMVELMGNLNHYISLTYRSYIK